MKKYTIEDLRKGRVILINDGGIEVCREVLREAFPNDGYKGGASGYYMVSGRFEGFWRGRILPTDFGVPLPTQSAADFLEKAWSPEEGELVEVSDHGNFQNSYKVVFIKSLKGRKFKVLAVCTGDEDLYMDTKLGFSTEMWKYMRQIESTEVTLAEIAEKFGCALSKLKIVDNEN